ncbi:MAG: ABC transporter ATP-binding protein [Flammeovirgaceae bacterium]
MQQETSKKSGNIFDGKILRRIFVFVQPYIGSFYFLIFLTLLMAVLAPAIPLLIQITVDQHIVLNNYDGLVNMVYLMVGITVIKALIQYAHTYLSGWLGQSIIRDMRVKLYQHILKLRLQFFDNTPIGKLVTRTVSDIETLSEVFTNGLAAIIGDLLQLIFIIFVMLCIDWRLTLVSLTTLPILLFATYIFKEKVKSAFNQVRTAVSNLNTFVQEHITGMSVVQIFNSERREYEKFRKINKRHLKANLNAVMYYSVYFPVAEIISAVSTGLLVWYGTREVLGAQMRAGIMDLPFLELESQITLGTLIAFIMYLSMFFRPIRMIADRFNTLQLGIVSSDRILKLLDDQSFIQNKGNYQTGKLKGNVVFKDVWFAYIDEDYVLKNINFEVKQGETIAFVGATGAGKSSIINLLTRFYEINKGKILVDGRDVHEYDVSYLREHIGMVLQDVFLFSDTIKQNITLGNPDISQEQVEQAAELVGAKEFIDKLPGRFEYNVMERGATLSVGQRQLISFVRAMVYDPQIIILDEATSSVDSETEEMIQSAIDRVMKGRTAIVIAHRLATIQKADKIVVLDKGEIKEIGTHEVLLSQGGYYTKLYEMQFAEVS